MPITPSEMSDLFAEVRNKGYEQLDCNEEGLTDFGDAVRLVSEDSDYFASLLARVTPEQEVEMDKMFADEFEGYVKRPAPPKAKRSKVVKSHDLVVQPGETFWDAITRHARQAHTRL